MLTLTPKNIDKVINSLPEVLNPVVKATANKPASVDNKVMYNQMKNIGDTIHHIIQNHWRYQQTGKIPLEEVNTLLKKYDFSKVVRNPSDFNQIYIQFEKDGVTYRVPNDEKEFIGAF